MTIRTDDVIIDDAAGRLSLSGTSGNLRLGGSGADGDVLLFASGGDIGDDVTATVHIDGQGANLRMGGSGSDGDLLLFRSDGDRTDDATATVHVDGQGANLRMGGSGSDGDLLLFRSDGDRTDDATATIHVDGQGANLRMGGSGSDGDLLLFRSDGDRTDDATATIHLDGNAGHIVSRNGHVAEHFAVADVGAASPGSVMVLDDDGLLTPCTEDYDTRAVGVVAGTGTYRAAIVLDQNAGGSATVPIAILGKVTCMVDASFGAVAVGDLLTSSETPGHAMRVDQPVRAIGSIIGKALTPLAAGQGQVDIIVGLQ